MNVQKFRVEGMTCDGCALSLRKAIDRRDSSLHVKIDFKTGLVAILPPDGGATTSVTKTEHLAQIVADAAREVGFAFAGNHEIA